MKKATILILISLSLISCEKKTNIELEDEPIIIYAGEDIVFEDEFCVILHADSLIGNQKGEWNIVSGIIDEKVTINDKNSHKTAFNGLPGEKYLLTWKVSEGEKFAIDTILVTFKPLSINILCDNNPNYSTRKHISVNPKYKGNWDIQGDYSSIETTQLGGQIIPVTQYPSIIVNGKENSILKAIWKVDYGSVSFSDTLIINTGEYTEYEALEDLQLISNPNYVTENGHVVEIRMNNGRGWIFMEPQSFPSLKALKHLRYLSLQGEHIRSFSDSIAIFYKDLEVLNLSGNQIYELPENIGLLKKLKKLDLFGNDIERIPNSFGGLESLVYLDMVSSSFKELPESFGNLKNLKYFNILDLELNSLPISFGNLKSLVFFQVGIINSNLPDSFCNLTNLEEFIIGFGNKPAMHNLPINIGKLKKLRRLIIKNNILSEEIPESFSDLTSLEELQINSCIKELPERFWHLSNLKTVRLTNTSLTSLPKSFPSTSNINTLIIDNIEAFKDNTFILPENIHQLNNLVYFSIRNAKIGMIPNNLCNLNLLTDLLLINCNIQYLPANIGDLKNLRRLDLAYNDILELQSSFKNLTSLKYLNVCKSYNLAWQINEIKSWFPYLELVTCYY